MLVSAGEDRTAPRSIDCMRPRATLRDGGEVARVCRSGLRRRRRDANTVRTAASCSDTDAKRGLIYWRFPRSKKYECVPYHAVLVGRRGGAGVWGADRFRPSSATDVCVFVPERRKYARSKAVLRPPLFNLYGVDLARGCANWSFREKPRCTAGALCSLRFYLPKIWCGKIYRFVFSSARSDSDVR